MKTIIIILSALVLTSCFNIGQQDINCKYQGAVVYENGSGSMCLWTYKIKYKGELIDVCVYEKDRHYKCGDTINGPCIK